MERGDVVLSGRVQFEYALGLRTTTNGDNYGERARIFIGELLYGTDSALVDQGLN